MTIDRRRRDQIGEAAAFIKAVGNRNRLLIVCRLAEGECAVSELESDLDIRQPILSQQLAELREAGLIEPRREAKAVFYRLADDKAQRFVAAMHEIFCTRSGAGPLVPETNRENQIKTQRRGEAAVFAHIAHTQATRT